MPRINRGIVYDDRGRPVARSDRYGRGSVPLQGAGDIPQLPPTPGQSLSDIASNLFESTDPLRQQLIGQSTNFMSGGMNPMETPEYAAIRSYADQQASRAKDSILETMPSGGTLLDKLADVDIGKARTLTDASAGIYGDNLSRAMSLATGAPLQASISGTSAAAQLKAAQDSAGADRDAAGKNAVGTGVGMALGGKD